MSQRTANLECKTLKAKRVESEVLLVDQIVVGKSNGAEINLAVEDDGAVRISVIPKDQCERLIIRVSDDKTILTLFNKKGQPLCGFHADELNSGVFSNGLDGRPIAMMGERHGVGKGLFEFRDGVPDRK
jgi:hypothetical protein